MADPFDITNTDAATDAQAAQNGGGSLLDSPAFWRNLQTFGAQTMVAANARTPGGFLQYGSGALGPIGAGILGSMEQNRQNAALQSQLGLQGAQRQNLQQELAQKRVNSAISLGSYNNFMAPLYGMPKLDQNGNEIPGSVSDTQSQSGAQPQASVGQQQPQSQQASGGGGAGGDLASIIRGIEGGYGTGTNAGRYAGAYQFGSAALMDAGLYKPAQGEDVKANSWQGQITIPGFPPMTEPQFAANPQAQDAAFKITGQRNLTLAQQNGLTNYIGQNVGGVPITPATIIAGAHFGGLEGVSRFVASGGKYNPSDNNGTSLSNYMLRVASVKQQLQGQQMAQAGAPQQAAPMAPGDAMQLARGVLSGAINPTPEQARQAGMILSRIPGMDKIGVELLKFGQAGPQAAAVAQATGANQVPQGYERTADGRMVPIPGGPADPNLIARQSLAKGFDVRQGGMHYDPILGWVRNPELVPTVNTTPGPNYGAPGKVWAVPPIIGGNAPGGQTASQEPGAQQGGSPVPVGDQGLARMPNGNIGTPGGGGLAQSSAGTQGKSPFAIGEGGQPLQTGLAPMGEEFQKHRGEDLAEQFQSIDTHAAAAIDGNYLLDNMRRESQSWDMGRFAEWKGEGKAYLQAFAQSLGIATPDLDKSLADYQAFVKSTGQITRAAVHETSSRAAAQEYQMIQSTLPSPEMSSQAFGQIADQMQGVYDYNLAKQKFAHAYTGDPNEMNIDFNKRLTPGAFMVNRMSQSPQGQQDLQVMISNMSKTPQGRARAQQLQNEVKYAQQNGYFDMIDYSGDRQASAPAAAQTAAPAQP